MFFKKNIDKEEPKEYVEPLNLLFKMKYPENTSKEVMYTLDNEEIVREDGKYYICDTVNYNVVKEITREDAYELIDTYKIRRNITCNNIFED